jgi:hypothetical protein
MTEPDDPQRRRSRNILLATVASGLFWACVAYLILHKRPH